MKSMLPRLFIALLTATLLVLPAAGCEDPDIGGCNDDGICDPDETCEGCDDCCAVSCELADMTGGTVDLLVAEIYLPPTAAAARENGVDLDGDGRIDNKLGELISAVGVAALDEDINVAIAEELALGDPAMVLRVSSAQEHGDPRIALQVLVGTTDASPNFDGHDSVTLEASGITAADSFVCGENIGSAMETTPGALAIPLTLPVIGTLLLPLESATFKTVVDPQSDYYYTSSVENDAWSEVMVGGGISLETLHNELLPFLTDYINWYIANRQSDPQAGMMTELLDGNCLTSLEGCADATPGTGECAAGSVPATITATELRCHPLVHGLLQPDVDLDGDGELDALSVGLRIVRAVPVTVTP